MMNDAPCPDGDSDERKALATMYKEVAAQRDKIDDFRAKLLGFLPVVTGVGLFAVLEKDPPSACHFGAFTIIIGIVGALSSIGLFVHELRGITDCSILIAIGRALEHKLTKANTDAKWGSFSSRHEWGCRGFVSRETAALIVYPTTIAAWAFMAINALPGPRAWPWVIVLSAGLTALLVFIGAFWLAKSKLDDAESKIDHDFAI